MADSRDNLECVNVVRQRDEVDRELMEKVGKDAQQIVYKQLLQPLKSDFFNGTAEQIRPDIE